MKAYIVLKPSLKLSKFKILTVAILAIAIVILFSREYRIIVLQKIFDRILWMHSLNFFTRLKQQYRRVIRRMKPTIPPTKSNSRRMLSNDEVPEYPASSV